MSRKIALNRQLDDLIRDENERNLHPAASSPLSETTNKKKARSSELGVIYISRKLKILNSSGLLFIVSTNMYMYM